VDEEPWQQICNELNGAGVESMQSKWDEMFGVKEEEVLEEQKVKKPRRKVTLKKAGTTKKTATKKEARTKKVPAARKSTKKPAVSDAAVPAKKERASRKK
jgi:hypothetical protein